MNIVFFGTSQFAVPALEALVKADVRPSLVVTTPDAPRGRKQTLSPSPIKVKALELGLDIIQPKTLKDTEVLAKIAAVKPEAGVLAAYGKIIPKSLIDVFPKGILNIHPSLLPRWRGATPIQATILAGDEKTGVTIILIDEEVDHGPIISNFEFRISNFETYESLHDKLAKTGADLLVETLPKWLSEELSPIPQDHTKVTFCKKFSREDAKIDWSRSAEEIDRMVRALNPEPGTWTVWSLGRARDKQIANGEWQILKILSVQVLQTFQHSQECRNVVEDKIIFQHSAECWNVVGGAIGEVCGYNGRPVVKCGEGALILRRVQPEGRKPMSGADWLRGRRRAVTDDHDSDHDSDSD